MFIGYIFYISVMRSFLIKLYSIYSRQKKYLSTCDTTCDFSQLSLPIFIISSLYKALRSWLSKYLFHKIALSMNFLIRFISSAGIILLPTVIWIEFVDSLKNVIRKSITSNFILFIKYLYFKQLLTVGCQENLHWKNLLFC